MIKKLTDKTIQGLRPSATRYEVWEGDGFGVRVTPKGVKSFVFVYHFEGKSRRMTLGRYPAMRLSAARKAAADAREKLTFGIDPGSETVAKRRAERQAETVGELIDSFVRVHAAKRRTGDAMTRNLEKEVRPLWGHRKVGKVTRGDVHALLDRIEDRGAPIQANRVLALVRKMFNFAIDRGIVDVNPCARVGKRGEELKRTRMLPLSALPRFWWGLDEMALTPQVRAALRLSLVTAQRRGEVAGIRVGEIDEAERIWEIPGNRTKNGLPHAVPLSELALTIVRDAKDYAAKRLARDLTPDDPLFPSNRGEGRWRNPIAPDALTRALIRGEGLVTKDRITPHDLRRTAHTHMGGEHMGADRFIRDRILNHADPTPGAHYDRYSYLAEKRRALDAWGALLSRLIAQTLVEEPAISDVVAKPTT